MFDKVQEHISIFRCDFCSELLPIKGHPDFLREQRVYLMTENPRKYLKHYDLEESLHMNWVVCCSDCHAEGSHKEYLSPEDKMIRVLFPYLEGSTYDALRQTMQRWEVTSHLKSEVMIAAHFVGERPVV
jgi:hypothetical protein